MLSVLGCGQSDVENVTTERNALGVTRVEIQRDPSAVELRGFDVNDRQLAYFSVRTGTVEFTYEPGDPVELTSGRDVSVGLSGMASPSVKLVIPGATKQPLFIPASIAPFTDLEVVRNEALRVGISFDVHDTTSVVASLVKAHETDDGDTNDDDELELKGASCRDYPGVWGATSANAMPAGSTCSLDVEKGKKDEHGKHLGHPAIPRDSAPFRSYQCVIGNGGSLVTSLFSFSACANDRDGLDHNCGDGSPSGALCVYGPCQKAGNTRISLTNPAGSQNWCSAGFDKEGGNWEYFLGDVKTCSPNGCSDGNGLNPETGCLFTSCCYDPVTKKACPYAGACPTVPSCP
jgi:hypothetical protein